MNLRDLGELGAIARMADRLSAQPLPPGWVGIGCDAAVTDLPPGRVCTTTDLLVEGIHFRRETTSAEDLGWKALIANISDIHAMGATPDWAVIGLSAPGSLPVAWVDALYLGLGEAATAHRCPIVGGDTTGSPGHITLAVAIVGHATTVRRRSHARPGDTVCATGPFGMSRAGLWALAHPDAPLDPAVREAVQMAHRRPSLPAARVPTDLARMALQDDSDGLATTLAQIAAASGVAIVLAVSRLPIAAHVRAVAEAAGVDPLDWALQGGEDYGLVGATPAEAVPAGFEPLGTVEAGTGVWLEAASGERTLITPRGFDPF